MISRVFGQTKPINYIIGFGFFLICLTLVQFRLFQIEGLPFSISLNILVTGCLLLSLGGGNFLSVSNQLTGPNVLTIYFFSIFSLIFPEIVLNYKAALANVCILISIYRLNQIRPFQSIQSNLFDASLAILTASLFLEWTLIHILLIWIYVYVFSAKKLRNWLIPFLAALVFVLIVFAGFMAFAKMSYIFDHYQYLKASTKAVFFETGIKPLIFLGVVLLLAFLGFRKFKRLGYGKVLPMRLTLLMLTLSLAVIFLQARVGQIPVLLAFYPASVFMSKYVESIQRKWHKDFVLLVFLVVGITAFAID